MQAKVDPSTSAVSVTCRMRFRATEAGAALRFSLNRALDVLEVITSQGTIREELGGKHWATYASDCALQEGDELSLQISYEGDPFAYGALTGSSRGPDSVALTPALWLPLPSVSPLAESASLQDLEDRQAVWDFSIQVPEGVRLLADSPGGLVSSPGEGQDLVLHGYEPDVLLAGEYKPAELSASGVAFEVWSTAETSAEGEFIDQAVSSLLGFYETLLGALPVSRVIAVLVPADEGLPLESFHPDCSLVTVQAKEGLGSNEVLQAELRRELAEVLGGLYVGDRGLAAYLADYVLSGHDPALREAACASRQRAFRSTLPRQGDRAVYDPGGPDSPALVNKAAAIWHMLATVYGEDEVVSVGVKLSRERVRGAGTPRTGTGLATSQEVAGSNVLAALPQDMAPVAQPWFEKAFRFDLALEDIEVAANEPQGGSSRSPRRVVSGTIADRSDPAVPWGLLPWIEVRVWTGGASESEDAEWVSLRVPLDQVQGGKARFAITLDGEPLKAALDPSLLDYDPANNTVRLSTERPPSSVPVIGAALLLLSAWLLIRTRRRRVPPPPTRVSDRWG